MSHPDHLSDPVRKGVVLATPDELRDRLRQLGRAAVQRDARLDTVRGIVQAHRNEPGALLPILHAVQQELGHVPADGVGEIAEGLNLSRAEVHGVITYYHHFRSQPAGVHVLELCRAESCRAMGSEALWTHACSALGLGATGGTTADGALTLQPVYCLGLCAQSPNAALDGQPAARMNATRLERLLTQARTVVGAAA